MIDYGVHQESFVQQLDALQALDQLVLLTAAKKHLPGDIIDILECLGKADNIPFNQLYSLAEDCADRYYMKVIQTLTHLMKNSFHDRQLVLVNTARVLKFLGIICSVTNQAVESALKVPQPPRSFS